MAKDFADGGTIGIPNEATHKLILMEKEHDFSVSGNDCDADEVCGMINIPAGMYVLGGYANVKVAEGSTAAARTGQIGDSDDPNGYLASANLDLNTVGVTTFGSGFTIDGATVTTDAVFPQAGGKYYSAASQIDFTPDTVMSNGKVTTGVWGFKIKE